MNRRIFIICKKMGWDIIWSGYREKSFICGICLTKDYSALISKLEQERVTRILFFPNNKIFKKINKCHIRNDEIHILCASLYSLLNANNPLLLSLKICTQNQKNPKLKSSLYRVSEQISLGKQLSKVLRQEIKELDNYSIQLIKVGEQSGLLPQALNSISRYYKRKEKLRKKVKSTLNYPIMILIMAAIIIIFFLLFIIPSFTNILTEFNTDLPKFTSFLLYVSQSSKSNSSNIFYVLIFIFSYIYLLPKGRKNKSSLEKFSQSIYKKIFFDIFILKFRINLSLSLGMMLKNNIDIRNCLETLISTENNTDLKLKLTKIKIDIKKGKSFTYACNAVSLYPQDLNLQIKIAEETGNLATALLEIAERLEAEYQLKLENYCELLPPIALIILGIIIGFMLLSLYIPIISLPIGL